MTITDIRMRLLENNSKMKATVSITIDGVFVVHDIKVIDGDKGLFIAMPSRKFGDDEFKDIAHPIDIDTRHMLQDSILAKYNEMILEEAGEAV